MTGLLREVAMKLASALYPGLPHNPGPPRLAAGPRHVRHDAALAGACPMVDAMREQNDPSKLPDPPPPCGPGVPGNPSTPRHRPGTGKANRPNTEVPDERTRDDPAEQTPPSKRTARFSQG
jgi:hypothetical protein